MKLTPDRKLDILEVLRDLEHYRPKRKGWSWREQVPDQDGREILREIKASNEFNSPVLVISGVPSDSIYLECMNIGADQYMSKPFDTDRLAFEARQIIQQNSMQTVNRLAPTEETPTGAGSPAGAGSSVPKRGDSKGRGKVPDPPGPTAGSGTVPTPLTRSSATGPGVRAGIRRRWGGPLR